MEMRSWLGITVLAVLLTAGCGERSAPQAKAEPTVATKPAAQYAAMPMQASQHGGDAPMMKAKAALDQCDAGTGEFARWQKCVRAFELSQFAGTGGRVYRDDRKLCFLAGDMDREPVCLEDRDPKTETGDAYYMYMGKLARQYVVWVSYYEGAQIKLVDYSSGEITTILNVGNYESTSVPVASPNGNRIAKVSAFDKGVIELEIYLDMGNELLQEESWHDRSKGKWSVNDAPMLHWLDNERLEIDVPTQVLTGPAPRPSILRTYTFVLDGGFWYMETLSTKTTSPPN